VGRRLGGDGTGRAAGPKIMLDFGGSTLLARHLRLLAGAGVAQATLVLGHGAEHVRSAMNAGEAGLKLRMVDNADYRRGSVVSLWAARSVLRSGDPILLMDADVLYDRRLMARLVESCLPDCFLLDRAIEPGDEPVKLCIRDGCIVDFRKIPTEPYQWHGESVGFFRFSPATAEELAARVEGYFDAGALDVEYEEPIRDMILAADPHRFGFEDISGLPWTEIDFPEDVVKARALLPELVA
jgi:choline kinase